jgi:hypothetical protein
MGKAQKPQEKSQQKLLMETEGPQSAQHLKA